MRTRARPPTHRDLYELWVEASRGLPTNVMAYTPPGPVALRARWHFIARLPIGWQGDDRLDVDFETWSREIDIETQADQALTAHHIPQARDLFERLLADASHPVVHIQAVHGLADCTRYTDGFESATSLYEDARHLAQANGFTFGVMRASLPRAYAIRLTGAASDMLSIAREVEAIAINIGDDLYVANALVAHGEALNLLRRRAEARDRLKRAMKIFIRLRSDAGIASAGLRLIDVQRMEQDYDGIVDTAPRVLSAARVTQQLTESVDVYDALAEAYTAQEAFADAECACFDGLSAAADRYPLGVANLLRTQGVLYRRAGWPAEAEIPLTAALEHFRATGLHWASALCLGQMARCKTDLGDLVTAVRLRLEACAQIELMRALQTSPDKQHEYRTRFDSVYRAALETVVSASDAAAFVAVFENLWGRRLPGLVDGVVLDRHSDPALLAQLMALNEQARRQFRNHDENAHEDSQSSTQRAIGRIALSGSLPQLYDAATATQLASALRPIAAEQAKLLLDSVPPDVGLLLVCELPGQPGKLAWLAKAPGDVCEVGIHDLTATELRAIDQWNKGWPHTATAADAHDLGALVPDSLRSLTDETRLVVIPLERLWALPWAALPVSTGLLGARHSLVISPSFTLATARTGTAQPAVAPDDHTVVAVGPGVRYQDVASLTRDLPTARSPAAHQALRSALLTGVDHDGARVNCAAVVAHGRPLSAVGHYIDLDGASPLTTTDLFNSSPPRSVAFISCWGASAQDQDPGEPLTIATIALARGAHHVLATRSELGDTPFAAHIVNEVLWRGRTQSWAEALHATLRRWEPELNTEPLVDWATLTVLGG